MSRFVEVKKEIIARKDFCLGDRQGYIEDVILKRGDK